MIPTFMREYLEYVISVKRDADKYFSLLEDTCRILNSENIQHVDPKHYKYYDKLIIHNEDLIKYSSLNIKNFCLLSILDIQHCTNADIFTKNFFHNNATITQQYTNLRHIYLQYSDITMLYVNLLRCSLGENLFVIPYPEIIKFGNRYHFTLSIHTTIDPEMLYNALPNLSYTVFYNINLNGDMPYVTIYANNWFKQNVHSICDNEPLTHELNHSSHFEGVHLEYTFYHE
jgi:hypothetical protein